MLKTALKLGSSLAKASKTKAAPDIIKAGAHTIGFVSKIAKPKKNKKKKGEEDRKQRARR